MRCVQNVDVNYAGVQLKQLMCVEGTSVVIQFISLYVLIPDSILFCTHLC